MTNLRIVLRQTLTKLLSTSRKGGKKKYEIMTFLIENGTDTWRGFQIAVQECLFQVSSALLSKFMAQTRLRQLRPMYFALWNWWFPELGEEAIFEQSTLSNIFWNIKKRAQTWNLSKILHRRIFRLKILHRQFHLISTVLVRKNTKNEWKWRNLHRCQKFYTAACSDGIGKFHLWIRAFFKPKNVQK